jgi:excisionase family DNA binding protein
MVAAREPDYYTVAEAAKLLRVSPSTIWRWIDARRLPAYRAGVRTIRIRSDDLVQFMRLVKEKGSEDLQEAQSVQTDLVIRPLTDEEVQRGLEALQKARELGEAIRARRGGEPLDPSLPLIHKAREERLKQLR